MISINMTLLGQMITFAIFVWFTMKFVWPPITQALTERQQKIADGLAAAERGRHELTLAQQKAKEYLHDAKSEAQRILETAHQRAEDIVLEAQTKARQEGLRLIDAAKTEIEKEKLKLKQALREDVAELAMMATEKLIEKNLDRETNRAWVKKILEEIK